MTTVPFCLAPCAQCVHGTMPLLMQRAVWVQALHNAGVVHRDVKPLNLILSESERRFKLIDLGAAADLRNGTNYAPDESILDPSYCPPEQYCLPTTGPHLGRQLAPLKLAISPLLWSRHKPDCFDSYSTGESKQSIRVEEM